MKWVSLISLAISFSSSSALDCSGSSSVSTSSLQGVKRCHEAGELIFEDEFDKIDFTIWDHEITMAGGGNWEFQVYWNNRTNSYTRDSVLYMKPTLTSDRFGEELVRTGQLDLWGGQPGDMCTMAQFYGCQRAGNGVNIINPVASARLRTAGHFGFTYGKVEARAQIPEGDWIWPAIWMLPIHQVYGGWPTSGEIDIMESRGNLNYVQDGVNIGAEQVGGTLHYGVDYTMNGWPKAHYDKNTAPGQGWNKDFHRYQVEWTPEYIKFSIDDEEMGTVTVPDGGMWELGDFANDFPGVKNPWEGQARSAPFDQEFFLVMNVAVGGVGYFSDDAQNSPAEKPWSNESPQASLDFLNALQSWYPTWKPEEEDGELAAMKVDYVKVWAL